MTNEKLNQRIQIVASKKIIDAIDEWRRKQTDLPSRSEAIRKLIEKGLKLPTETE
ncbi:hypothetical protein COMNV_00486 [Commensalibacter sp. Nvir]|uniref:hypothetical protein n=1 Tax=Commensalibacter sp. Nvir TaxID=3069817 RepID=UPI002D4D8F0A|nr:hypothetical protein COMNV_00486 [Commensalibacter sp. Nvir]